MVVRKCVARLIEHQYCIEREVYNSGRERKDERIEKRRGRDFERKRVSRGGNEDDG